jgi:hypothetical protein
MKLQVIEGALVRSGHVDVTWLAAKMKARVKKAPLNPRANLCSLQKSGSTQKEVTVNTIKAFDSAPLSAGVRGFILSGKL